MIPLSFLQHRDTQETLAVLERLDLDTEKPTEDELARKFGYEESYLNGTVSWWQHLKPQMWSLFDEPYSSNAAKVKCRNGMEGVNSFNLTKHQQGGKNLISPTQFHGKSHPTTFAHPKNLLKNFAFVYRIELCIFSEKCFPSNSEFSLFHSFCFILFNIFRNKQHFSVLLGFQINYIYPRDSHLRYIHT